MSEGPRQTWYFVAASSKLGDLYNMLHLPYTAMLLALVSAGAAASPMFHPDVLAATLGAYALGLGLGAHSVDQLDPGGSHYVKWLSRRELVWISVLGLAGGSLIGVYYALTLTLWLLPFIAANLFFAFAYPLPSRVAGGLFHSNLTFAFSWGFLPALTSSFANSLVVSPVGVGVCAVGGAVAWVEIRLSRKARAARKSGLPREGYEASERSLKLLAGLTCLAGLALVVYRLLAG